MSTIVNDAGARFIIKKENIRAACNWLDSQGEFPSVIGEKDGYVLLGTDDDFDSSEGMFCGYRSFHITCEVDIFMRNFCEENSFACLYFEDFNEYAFVWKDKTGVHHDNEVVGNPFSDKMEQMTRS